MRTSASEERRNSPAPAADWRRTWTRRARQLQQETAALFLAYRDPRVPWYAKAWAALLLAYALSPIDLIPDPIPVLGQLDDFLLIPVGVLIALRLIPTTVVAEAREKAARGVVLPVSRAGGVIVVVLWAVAALLVIWGVLRVGLPWRVRTSL